jgi:UDP-GlcNAc:undecaprenyl-phosphate GlcNAc-1-phosphate transferase
MPEPWLLGFTRFSAAAAITILAIRILGPLAHRFGWLDRPQGRKDHTAATPFTGGLAMLIAVLLTLPIMPLASDTLLAFGIGFVALLVVGSLDDLYDLPWAVRLLAHFCVALQMVYVGGVRIDFIGPATDPASLALGIYSTPFTVLVTVCMINALNMIDGIDGAAGCVALAALILLGAVCALIGNDALRDRIVLFMGVTTGFLIMNLRHPWQSQAQVFLGNSGSAIVGFGLAWLIVRISQSTADSYSTIFAPWFLALPLIDAFVVILRRLQRRRSPFHADHGHLHHLLIDAGYSPTRAALTMGAASLLLGLIALCAARAQMPAAYQIALFFAVIVLYYLCSYDRPRAVRALHRCSGNNRKRGGDPSTMHYSE